MNVIHYSITQTTKEVNMKVGDLVTDDCGMVGIIVDINTNGDCKVQIREHVFLIHPQWLEVI